MPAKPPYNVWMGYDPREDLAYRVAQHSIMSRTDPKEVDVIPLTLKNQIVQELLTRPIEVKDGKLWCPISQAHMATEFAISRFVVPFIQGKGWCLFVDSDIVCFVDIRELFALADDRYAVMCVKHVPSVKAWKSEFDDSVWLEPSPGRLFHQGDGAVWHLVPDYDGAKLAKAHGNGVTELSFVESLELFTEFKHDMRRYMARGDKIRHWDYKMDGQIQTFYNRKNWSSVMLINCDHPAMERFTLKDLNERPGRDLHAFCWLKDEEIGELEHKWNVLVGVDDMNKQKFSGIWHYTLGGPFLPGWKGGEFDHVWRAAEGAMKEDLQIQAASGKSGYG